MTSHTIFFQLIMDAFSGILPSERTVMRRSSE